MRIAVVGAGWAGLSAAVHARLAGHQVEIFEAATQPGGRARALPLTLPDGRSIEVDNGQHILIGAYSATLNLMQHVGVKPQQALMRLPLALCYPDGSGLQLPPWPAPMDAVAGLLTARGWPWSARWALLRRSLYWQAKGFRCRADTSVQQLCAGLPTIVMESLIEPLCVSALNTPAERASGQVFLRVLQDSLFGGQGASNLLLPRTDLGRLLPQAAVAWLRQQGSPVHLGQRVRALTQADVGWAIDGQTFDAVVLATSAPNAALALENIAQRATDSIATAVQGWIRCASALAHEAIATVYTYCPGARLPQPMLALHSNAGHPAQFVFDRGQLGGPDGLWAFVVSASGTERGLLTQGVLAQARGQLPHFLGSSPIVALQTVVEKRATFACSPGLARPELCIAPGLWACGDYVEGPYPATLEGAVRSGVAVVHAIGT
ncbi:hydroxysqualene dehydroxylase HpnE [Curvibacter sp. APW13]|uniref:hydroxysqualene dehydroxylase HpnE n=1 Tax=Curvibacter sp. APW13 TaxID=3077236 RepID=UPI0028DE4334|nr:hydroxysqualene dehydroxylase HpnE [Curvibacter sp. APW13]MDT8991218.1 hydroxysqualene dehydroxylase HpnE [Curvibacter sp. APW13]